jgi:hypothetical protein
MFFMVWANYFSFSTLTGVEGIIRGMLRGETRKPTLPIGFERSRNL